MTDDILDAVKDLLSSKKGDPIILGRILRAAERDEVISIHERRYVKRLAGKPATPIAIPPAPPPKPLVPPAVRPPEQVIVQHQKSTRTASYNTKIILVIAAALLVALLAVGLTLSNPEEVLDTLPEPLLKVSTDSSSYLLGDIISISGTTEHAGDVILSMYNGVGERIWEEVLLPRTGGAYSTLTIAGGDGWESAGTYTVRAEQGEDAIESTFEFRRQI